MAEITIGKKNLYVTKMKFENAFTKTIYGKFHDEKMTFLKIH